MSARARGGSPGPVAGDQWAGERRPWRCAAWIVLPIFLLSLAWAFSNPPGAAPDEQHHLVKALGTGVLSNGTAGQPAAADAPANVATRNASITRIYEIPARLVSGPAYTCFAFKPDVTAACLPPVPATAPTGTVPYRTPIGAYPPFLYLPIGLVAVHAPNVPAAFHAGRVVVAVFSSLMLLLAISHLVRWLGRGAGVVVVAALSPMAVYTFGVLSVSGIEIAAACGVAAVVAVALRRPESVEARRTHVTLAISGGVLALSRQLGVVELAAMVLLLFLAVGVKGLGGLFRTRRPSFVVAVAVLAVTTVMVVVWERTFDHPSNTGPALQQAAVGPFLDRVPALVVSAVGKFGWLDTPLPTVVVGAWVALWVLTIGVALVVATLKERFAILALVAGTFVLAYAIYASVFYPVKANVQGRQFLPLVACFLVLAGAAWTSRAARLGRVVTGALMAVTVVVVTLSHAFAIYWNARRYAVGSSGPLRFLGAAQWSPPGGWVPWLLLAAFAAVLLGLVLVLNRPTPAARRVLPPEDVREAALARARTLYDFPSVPSHDDTDRR